MKQYLFLCIALAATVCKASAQQKAVEQICITVDSMLNAQLPATHRLLQRGRCHLYVESARNRRGKHVEPGHLVVHLS